ncbi:hypothetical protein BN7_6644 [Wickerhamomyces ciferrii]|uniref:Reverse transcriptase zinc-binding domain-containing protein n=1 Tax=Wickerhamomyces ciferrii (strain ATCC 14091 / BCRC 22168 / CBS 111 / JCM 3599 / NBRC 0793 / NRRL Y-1031 F-60-10) TaxID=1206466 RepID=K0KP29_WICCF|nr:uncharacterized protein BN7_6644 [Wickerhamomyces ciferrii]CCH47035.1 hypothetical protein BN7_6644 [Wickerhamomyces ciferrii]
MEFFRLTKAEINHRFIQNVQPSSKALHSNVRDIKDEKVQLESFLHYNRKYHEEKGLPIQREIWVENEDPQQEVHFTKQTIPKIQWKTFWYKLYKSQTQAPGLLEFYQRFNLGHFEHMFERTNESNTQEDLPNLNNEECCLCGEQKETFQHYFQQCSKAQQIWTYINKGETPIKLKDLQVNLQPTKAGYILMNRYIECLVYLRKRRRFGSQVLNYDQNEMMGQAKLFLTFKSSKTAYYSSN